MERNRLVQKYIVSGTKKFRFSVMNFHVKSNKKRCIEKGNGQDYKVLVNNIKFEGHVTERKQNKYKVSVNGNSYSFSIDTEKAHKRKAALALKTGADKLIQVKSPMPGKICNVIVNEGEVVQKGEALLILEAMKMQNEIQSQESGLIKKVFIKQGENVTKDQRLLELELV